MPDRRSGRAVTASRPTPSRPTLSLSPPPGSPPGSRPNSPVTTPPPTTTTRVPPKRPTRERPTREEGEQEETEERCALTELRREHRRKRLHLMNWDWEGALDGLAGGSLEGEVASVYSTPLTRGESMHALAEEISDVITDARNVITRLVSQ